MPYYPPSSGGGGAGTVVVTTTSGTPSIAADTIKFPQGFVTDLGSGDAQVGVGAAGFIGCRIRNSGNVSLTNGSDTLITFDSERFDTDGFHSTSSNTGRITIPAGLGGKYLIGANTDVTASPGAGSYCGIRLNGTTYIATAQVVNDASYATAVTGTVYDLAAGDYIEFLVHVNAASKNALAAGNYSPEFWVVKLDSGKVGQGIGCYASSSSDTNLTTATDTAIALNAADTFDTDGFHDPSTNNTRITIPAGLGGKYLITCVAALTRSGGSMTDRRVTIRVNGTTSYLLERQYWSSAAATQVSLDATVVLSLNAGDYIEMMGYSDGSSTTCGGSVSVTRLDSGNGVPTFRGCHAYHNTTEAVNNAVPSLNSEAYDTDNYHFTSSSALTGTVSKTSGSAAIVGSGTSFTTELSVNQVITIPGTATEVGVVKTITDNTNLTLWQTMANTASGQTATRYNKAVAIPAGLGGYYAITAFMYDGSGSDRFGNIMVNGAAARASIFGGRTSVAGSQVYYLSPGDYVTMLYSSNSTIGHASAASAQTGLTLAFLGT